MACAFLLGAVASFWKAGEPEPQLSHPLCVWIYPPKLSLLPHCWCGKMRKVLRTKGHNPYPLNEGSPQFNHWNFNLGKGKNFLLPRELLLVRVDRVKSDGPMTWFTRKQNSLHPVPKWKGALECENTTVSGRASKVPSALPQQDSLEKLHLRLSPAC